MVLRKTNQAKWYKNPHVPWLTEGHLQADALIDLKTEANRLSIYYISDDDPPRHKERVIVALAANAHTISNLDYFLLDVAHLDALAIQMDDRVKGDTADDVVNSWHRDLIELTATKLFGLANAIHAKAEIDRVMQPDIENMLLRSIVTQQIDFNKLNPNMQGKIDELENRRRSVS